MLLRAAICTVILLTQPLAAWAGVMQMPSMDESAMTGAMAEHCDDMPGHAGSDSEPDCDISCDNCVAAAAVMYEVGVVKANVIHTQAPAFLLRVLPPGATERLYRPPSLS